MTSKLRRVGTLRKKLNPLLIKGDVWQSLPSKTRDKIVEAAFCYWRAKGFPYFRLSKAEIQREFVHVLGHDWGRVFRDGDLISSNAGLRLANAYQHGMWRAKVSRYLSPMDVFRDDALLRSALKRALTIWPSRYGANASSLRRMLKTYPGAASVSNYRPAIARAVITKYSPEGGAVVDFAAGYGGRLLGALATDRSYLGIEPNRRQIAGYERMQRAVGAQRFDLPNTEFVHGAAEECLPALRSRSADLVFSSPPFFDWEKYSKGTMQSCRRYPNYPEWHSRFLLPIISDSHRILRRSGFLVVNVTNSNRRPSPIEVRALAEHCGFSLKETYAMVFPKVPYLHPRDGRPVKQESVMVFQK
jgi:hypothetical protein